MKATLTFTAVDQDDTSMAAAPTTGTWTKGDRVWNSNPTPGENVGWICTESGSPGTFEPFGVIGLP